MSRERNYKIAEEVCNDYLDMTIDNAKKKPESMSKLVNILIEVKRWSVSKVADSLNSRPDTIERYRNKKSERPKELSDEMQKKIFKCLKLI